MQKEIWKDIPGYECIYQVSSFGGIRNIKTGKLLKPYKHICGYKMITLSKKNNRKNFLVHQLVAIAFLNHKPNGNNLVVDHIDNDKTNNNITNLQVVTHRENSSKEKRNDQKYSSKYTGVSWNKKQCKWQSAIYVDGKNIAIGLFDTEVEASNAYQYKLSKLED